MATVVRNLNAELLMQASQDFGQGFAEGVEARRERERKAKTAREMADYIRSVRNANDAGGREAALAIPPPPSFMESPGNAAALSTILGTFAPKRDPVFRTVDMISPSGGKMSVPINARDFAGSMQQFQQRGWSLPSIEDEKGMTTFVLDRSGPNAGQYVGIGRSREELTQVAPELRSRAIPLNVYAEQGDDLSRTQRQREGFKPTETDKDINAQLTVWGLPKTPETIHRTRNVLRQRDDAVRFIEDQLGTRTESGIVFSDEAAEIASSARMLLDRDMKLMVQFPRLGLHNNNLEEAARENLKIAQHFAQERTREETEAAVATREQREGEQPVLPGPVRAAKRGLEAGNEGLNAILGEEATPASGDSDFLGLLHRGGQAVQGAVAEGVVRGIEELTTGGTVVLGERDGETVEIPARIETESEAIEWLVKNKGWTKGDATRFVQENNEAE